MNLFAENAERIYKETDKYTIYTVKRATNKELTGDASNGIIHLINSGAACLDATGEQSENGRPAVKPYWEISENEVELCLTNTKWGSAV